MADFDPYRDWLGINASARPLNHYELLGLPTFTKEPPVIAEAAEEQTARLGPHLTGPYAALAQRIVQEIAAARKQLLSSEGRKAYDESLRRPAPAASAPPVTASRPASAPPAAAVPPQPPVAAPPMAAPLPYANPVQAQAMPVHAVPYQNQYVPQVAPYGGVPAAPIMPGAPRMAAPLAAPGYGYAPHVPSPVQAEAEDQLARAARIYSRSRRSSLPMAIGILATAIVCIGGALVFANRDKLFATNSVPSDEQQAPPASTPVKTSRPSEPPPPQTREEAARSLAEALGMRQGSSKPSRQPPPAKMTAGNNGSKPSLGMPDPSFDKNKPNLMPDKTASAPITASGAMTNMTAMAAAVTAPASEQETSTVNRSLVLVRKSLVERNVTKAREQLDLATIEAFSTDTVATVTRMQQLVDAVDKFWTAVIDESKKLEPKQVLEVGDEKITIVSVEDDMLSVRIGAASRNFQFSKMPPNLARALAERALGADTADAKLAVGAFLAVDPNGDRLVARQLWDEAGQLGANVAALLTDLDAEMK